MTIRKLWEMQDHDGEIVSLGATGGYGKTEYGIAVHGEPRPCACADGSAMLGVFMSIEDLKALRDAINRELANRSSGTCADYYQQRLGESLEVDGA